MQHLIGTLDSGHSIGHYGRLVFAMVARHFLDREELLTYLEKDPECDAEQARSLVAQVEARDYNPPKRERISRVDAETGVPGVPQPRGSGTVQRLPATWNFRRRCMSGSNSSTWSAEEG